MDKAATQFTEWFKRHGTQHAAIGLAEFPGMGRGAVALEDIAVSCNAIGHLGVEVAMK